MDSVLSERSSSPSVLGPKDERERSIETLKTIGTEQDRYEDLQHKFALLEGENRRLERENKELKVAIIVATNEVAERDETVRVLRGCLQKYSAEEEVAASGP
jgi:predicted  nucleic acid-binding Zn-ribbon protein